MDTCTAYQCPKRDIAHEGTEKCVFNLSISVLFRGVALDYLVQPFKKTCPKPIHLSVIMKLGDNMSQVVMVWLQFVVVYLRSKTSECVTECRAID